MALYGDIETKVEFYDEPPNRDRRRLSREKDQYYKQKALDAVDRLGVPTNAPTVLFYFGHTIDAPFEHGSTYGKEIVDKAWPRAQILGNWNAGRGIVYNNGKLLRDTGGILKLSGALPQQTYLFSRGTHPFYLQYESSERLCNFDSFGEHPLARMTRLLGSDNLKVILHSEKIECLNVKYAMFTGDRWDPHYTVVGSAPTQNAAFRDRLLPIITAVGNGPHRSCEGYNPRELFRFWRGKQHVDMPICFTDEAFELQGKTRTHLEFSDRNKLLESCIEAFPEDAELKTLYHNLKALEAEQPINRTGPLP
jgi:hypothetical protein